MTALPVDRPRRRGSYVPPIAIWTQVAENQWTASASGIYIGRIERTRGKYWLTDDRNLRLRSFRTLADAQGAHSGGQH
jgi:hypothetical protein